MKQRLRPLLFPLLLVVLVPVFATGILCYTFQDGVIHSVPFGVIDEDNSALSRTLVQTLAHNDIFDVVFYGDGAEELEAQLVQNQIVAGMIIPKDFSRDVTAGSSPSILLVYDGCQMSVVGISKVKLAEVLTTLRVAASIQILEGRLDLQPQEALLYAQPLSNTFRYLGNPEKSLRNYVVPGAVANIVQLTMYMFLVEAIRKEEEKAVHPLLYCLLGSSLTTAVLLCCVRLMQGFGMPMQGAWSTIALLSFFNMLGIGNVAAIIRLLLPEKQKVLAVQAAVVVMAMLLFSGYTFPALGMPPFFQAVAEVIPFTHFALPLRDVLLLGSSTALVSGHLRWLFLFAAFTALPVILLWLFFRQKQLSRRETQKQPAEPIQQAEQEEVSLC